MATKAKTRAAKIVVLTEDPVFDYQGDDFSVCLVSGDKSWVFYGKPKRMFAGFSSAKTAIRRWLRSKASVFLLRRPHDDGDFGH